MSIEFINNLFYYSLRYAIDVNTRKNTLQSLSSQHTNYEMIYFYMYDLNTLCMTEIKINCTCEVYCIKFANKIYV